MDTHNLQKRLINFDLLRVAAMFGIVVFITLLMVCINILRFTREGQCGGLCLRIISLCQKLYMRYAILL